MRGRIARIARARECHRGDVRRPRSRGGSGSLARKAALDAQREQNQAAGGLTATERQDAAAEDGIALDDDPWVARARAVERRLGERGEEVRAEPGERYGGRGEGGGTCEAGVCVPQSCARAAPCMKSGRGLAHLMLPCFAPLKE